MLDQNTDRMWYVIGAIIIGGLILTSSIILFTDVAFAGVQDAFSMFSNVADVNEIPDYYVLATDDDFEWRTDGHDSTVESGAMYESKYHNGTGYYRYIGSDSNVIIPKEINGDKVTSYYRMFYKCDVNLEGVILDPSVDVKDITSMRSMFSLSKGSVLDLSLFMIPDDMHIRHMFGSASYDLIYVPSDNVLRLLQSSDVVPKSIDVRVFN